MLENRLGRNRRQLGGPLQIGGNLAAPGREGHRRLPAQGLDGRAQVVSAQAAARSASIVTPCEGTPYGVATMSRRLCPSG